MPQPPTGVCGASDTGDTSQTADNNESHDTHEIHQQECDGQEDTPIPEETEEAPEHSVDPNRSQYDSGHDEFPLDTFDEYIEVEESDGDSDVVYIRTAREMSPSQTKDLINLANMGSVSEDPSMTETEVVSAMNPVIPRDLSPQELLFNFA